MNKHDQGYGICGAKNIYSSKTKLNNYNEDLIGRDLSHQTRTGSIMTTTVTSSAYIEPVNQPKPPPMPVSMPTTQELKAKNKDGMSYSLLFEHGIKDIGPEDRYKSVSKLTIMNKKDDEPEADANPLTREKLKYRVHDLRLSYNPTSQTRLMNGHISYKVSDAPDPSNKAKDVVLPNFTRQRKLTGTIPGFH